jgi:hypothetical protein
VPSSIKEIKPYTFYNYKALLSVELNENITKIGDYAFGNCANLDSFTLGKIKHIGAHAFEGTAFLGINIPEGVEYIGDFAFAYCNDVKIVIIGKNVRFIGEYAFSNLQNVSSVSFEDEEGWYVTSDKDAATGDDINITEEGHYLVVTPHIHQIDNPYWGLCWKKN